MQAGTLLLIVHDVVEVLAAEGIITSTGDFDQTKFDSLQNDLTFASAIEGVLKKHGVPVSGKVDAIIALLPSIAKLFA